MIAKSKGSDGQTDHLRSSRGAWVVSDGGVVIGLCDRCVHVRRVATHRGSEFVLCGRSHDDPGYARYPRLPVMECRGFEPDETGEATNS